MYSFIYYENQAEGAVSISLSSCWLYDGYICLFLFGIFVIVVIALLLLFVASDWITGCLYRLHLSWFGLVHETKSNARFLS